MSDKLFKVGEYVDRFNVLTGQNLPCGAVYQSIGLAKHIEKRHPSEMGNLLKIPLVVSAPDYIGHNPKEPDSVELVKVLDGNVMVCIKLDVSDNLLYVASVFSISEGKLKNRLNSGRLISVSNVDNLQSHGI